MTQDPLEMLREKAQDALARGKYQDARQLYQQALGYRSDHADLHYGMATVCFVLSDLHSAVYHFKEATRLEPSRAGAYVNLGAVYNRLGQYEDALTALRRGIQLDTNRAEGYYNLGLVYRHLGQLEMAVNAYREAVRVNPRMFDAHLNLGNIFFEKQQFALAIAHYRQALEIRPKWGKAEKALALATTEQAKNDVGSVASAPAPSPAPVRVSKLDPGRLIDPAVHGDPLHDLQPLVVEADQCIQEILEFLENQVEGAIHDLSVCILTPSESPHNLEVQLQKFEQVTARLQQMQDAQQKRMLQIRQATEGLAQL